MKLPVALVMLVVLAMLPQNEAATKVSVIVAAAVLIHIPVQLNNFDYVFISEFNAFSYTYLQR